MIEVLENKAKKECECPGCGSVLGYLPTDVDTYYGNDYVKKHIVCPLCDEDIIVEKVDIVPIEIVEPSNIHVIFVRCRKCNKGSHVGAPPISGVLQKYTCSWCNTDFYVKGISDRQLRKRAEEQKWKLCKHVKKKLKL